MSSENAKAVAREVITKVRSGKKVNLQEIQQNHGYSKWSAKAMKGTRNETFKKETKPLSDGLAKEIERIKLEMASRDISEERYETLTRSLDILIKNYQLITGGATERQGISITFDETFKNK